MNQKGQIVTVLTLIALGVMTVGVFVGSKVVQKPTSPFYSEATDCTNCECCLAGQPDCPTACRDYLGSGWTGSCPIENSASEDPSNCCECHQCNNCECCLYNGGYQGKTCADACRDIFGTGCTGSCANHTSENFGSCCECHWEGSTILCNQPQPTSIPTITSQPTATSTPTLTLTSSPTPTETPGLTSTPTLTVTPTPNTTPTITPTTTPELTITPGESPTSTPTPTSTPSPTLPPNCPFTSRVSVKDENGQIINETFEVHNSVGNEFIFENGSDLWETTNLPQNLQKVDIDVSLHEYNGNTIPATEGNTWQVIGAFCDLEIDGKQAAPGFTCPATTNPAITDQVINPLGSFNMDCGAVYDYGWILKHSVTVTPTVTPTLDPTHTSTDYSGSSTLNPTSCLQNDHLKICFDDVQGGTIQGLYNMNNPTHNFIHTTMGAGFQLAFRSTDPIIPCPVRESGQYAITWGAVWNPTQAGCEICYENDGKIYHSPSQTSGSDHYIEFRPRNYFHHNMGDCSYPLPYTEDVIQAEDIYIKQQTQLGQDDLTITWNIKHEGNHTHYTDRANYYRHELPVIYFDNIQQEHVIYQDLQGNTHEEKIIEIPQGSKTVKDNRFTIYDPNKPEGGLTFINQNSLQDNSQGDLYFRNFGAGMQIEFSSWANIGPGQQFTVKTHISPYNHDKANFTVQGHKLNCPLDTKIVLDGNQETTTDPYFFHNVSAGTNHTVSLELPDGDSDYNISYSPCDCCIDHPSDQFTSGNQHAFTKTNSCEGNYDYYDLYWQCSLPSGTQTPTSTLTPSPTTPSGEGIMRIQIYLKQADVDNNGIVNARDYWSIIQNYGTNGANSDVNNDGFTNGLDLSRLLKFMGQSTE